MARESLPEHVRALRLKQAYPARPRSIELIQTHISFVFLVDSEVYKLKKPVDVGFADFTTLEKRRLACEAEVRLNRRGCEDVYLGVTSVTSDAGGYRINGEGEVVDYAVHMKRLPADRMMDALLAKGEVDFDMIGAVAGRLAELHRHAERGARVARIGGFETFRRNWSENLQQLRPFIGKTVTGARYERLRSFGQSAIESRAALLQAREKAGWVRDCHGDLRADAVCFDSRVPGGICIFDCIEFNDAFRYSDTGLDAAFLAMDLDYRGRPDLSDLFAGLYAAAVGDPQLPLLLNLFKCYRALVRGKVESLLLNDRHVGVRQKAAARGRARRYIELAQAYTRRSPGSHLVLVTGASGSGKSVLAGVLAARLGYVLLSTDMLRRELFQPSQAGGEALDSGKYMPASRERVYQEVSRRAQAEVKEGRGAVIDGTFLERSQREPLVRLAREAGLPFLLVECTVPDDVVRERQGRRQRQAWSTSEGSWEVYVAQKARREPPDELPAHERMEVDTSAPLEDQIAAVLSRLSGVSRPPG